jgi:transposase InsO family protein
MVQKCEDCQRYGNKKSITPERQIAATRPMEILGMDLVELKGRYALITVDYFSGYLTYDALNAQTSEAVIKVLNNNFRKFGLPEKILSDNGPCFRSDSFRRFCDQLDISHVT